MHQITVLYPESNRQTARVQENGLLVGRDDNCGLHLTDEFVSGRHCRIFPENDELFIEDLGSTNGTFVEGNQVDKKSRIEQGQSIQIGITVLKVTA